MCADRGSFPGFALKSLGGRRSLGLTTAKPQDEEKMIWGHLVGGESPIKSHDPSHRGAERTNRVCQETGTVIYTFRRHRVEMVKGGGGAVGTPTASADFFAFPQSKFLEVGNVEEKGQVPETRKGGSPSLRQHTTPDEFGGGGMRRDPTKKNAKTTREAKGFFFFRARATGA